MKKLIRIFCSILFSHLLCMMVASGANAQFAFELPSRDQEVFPPYGEIKVEVSGKLSLSSSSERGHIFLNVKGGQPPYSFKWNSRQTSQNRVNLHSGIYTVEIKDAAGTKHIEQVIIHPPLESQPDPFKKQSNSADLKKMKMVNSRTNLEGKRQIW